MQLLFDSETDGHVYRCSTLYGEGGKGVKGVRSFWRGNGIAVFKMTPEMALRQGIFETFRELRGDYDEIVRACVVGEECLE